MAVSDETHSKCETGDRATLTLLGTGTSAGIPIIGCECHVCRSDDPRDQRLRTAGALSFRDRQRHERTLLLDASPDLRQQALRQGITRCDGILFTHNHVDHTFGLDEVRRFNACMQQPIDIYADSHTLESLFRIYRHIFERPNNINDSFVATLIPHEITAGNPLDLFGVRITPIELLHGRLPVLGFRFDLEKNADEDSNLFPLAYCTDVSAIPPHSWPAFEGVNTLVLDMLRFRHHPTHFNVDQAIAAAEQINARRTIFVHMAHDILHAEVDATLPKGMALGHDGMKL